MPERLKEKLAAEDEKRQRWHRELTRLRERNKELSGKQRLDQIDKGLEKQKPLSMRNLFKMLGKSQAVALEITVLLNLIRKMKGLPLMYRPRHKCQCCGHVTIDEEPRPVHALPEHKWGLEKAVRIADEIVRELDLDEFLQD